MPRATATSERPARRLAARLRVDRLAGPAAPLILDDGRVLAGRCYRATGALARLVGLLSTPDLATDEALWLEPCASVHALGLRAPIGVAFLDDDGRVLRVVDPLPRGRAAAVRGAGAVVECRAGVLAGVVPGSRLRRGRDAGEADLPAPSELPPRSGGRDEAPGAL